MKIVYSDAYFGDADFKELRGEDWVGMAENPERMRMILAALADQGLRDVQTPEHHGPEAILRVPDAQGDNHGCQRRSTRQGRSAYPRRCA